MTRNLPRGGHRFVQGFMTPVSSSTTPRIALPWRSHYLFEQALRTQDPSTSFSPQTSPQKIMDATAPTREDHPEPLTRLPFPPVTKTHILNCSYHSWHPR